MDFTLLSVRTAQEQSDDLFPAPGDSPNSVAPLADDGDVRHYDASALTVVSHGMPRPRQLASVSGVRAAVMVTDSRVAVACSKYDKGSMWFGFGLIGLPLAVLLTVISKLMAAERRRGRMLVGHVRYEWLTAVDATGGKSVSLHLANPADAGGLMLLVILKGSVDAAAVAADIASRAARRKAALAGDAGEHRAALERYAGDPSFETNGTTRRYLLPRSLAARA